MDRQTPIETDSIRDEMRELVALRRELGLPGGRLTEEQKKIYLEAKGKLYESKKNQKTPIKVDSWVAQIGREAVALRRELGLPGGRLTDEQQKIYLQAKEQLYESKKKQQLEETKLKQ